jgi:PncC family amidohydrolase
MMAPDPSASLASLLVQRLQTAGWQLALAESCTGGLVAARVTSVPGASVVFRGGVVAYHNDAKRALLGVPAETLAASGAVSAETALAMAQGARKCLHADLAAAITGIAGPGGGTAEKPVGLVFIAVSGPRGEHVEPCHFGGHRDAIRSRACEATLRLLLQQVEVS